MGAVFGKEKPLKEVIRENQRMLKKAIRELEKVVRDMQMSEKKLISDIKKAAKLGQMVSYYTHPCMYIHVTTWNN